MIGTQPKATSSIQQLLPVFKATLSADAIGGLLAGSSTRFYQRLFTPLIVLWCLVFQRVNADHSCDAAVSYLGSGAVDHLDNHHLLPPSARMVSQSTAAFCKARQRFPLKVLKVALQRVAQHIQQQLSSKSRWLGHQVTLLDGTTFLMRPEPRLVDHYGQHTNNFGTTNWVVMRAVAAFCLHTGAALAVNEGSLHDSEQALAKEVFSQLEPGSVAVADQNFGVFSVAQAARHFGLWSLFRMKFDRAHALAQRKLASGEDIAVCWRRSGKSKYDPTMSTAPIEGRLLYLRVQPKGFRPIDIYLFTTLLDQSRYSAEPLLELYARRGHVELNLRYVKDTLDMSLLAGKSVDIIRKELWAGLLAYNLLRAYMSQAAQRAGLTPLALSFTKCWRRIRDTLSGFRATDKPAHIVATLLRLSKHLVNCKLPTRQRYRIEPRAVRHLPVVYPTLKGSRAEAREKLLRQTLEACKC
jgi:hypothetical protein